MSLLSLKIGSMGFEAESDASVSDGLSSKRYPQTP